MDDATDLAFLASVHQVWIWGPVRFVLERDGDWVESSTYVDVGRAELVLAGGSRTIVDFDADPVGSRAVVGVWQQRIAAATEDDGVLTLTFDSGDVLRADPDEQYESWTVAHGARTYVCLPGGEILAL